MSTKIVLIAPGYKPFPPNGWGAVESIVWDYYENLGKYPTIQVHIINTRDPNQIIASVNYKEPDVVHIMYDDYIIVAPYLHCKRILYTSHYAYITHPQFETKYAWYFQNIFKKVIENQTKVTIYAISEQIAAIYRKYGFQGAIQVLHNGAREDLFRFSDTPRKRDRSIYVAKVEKRKAQYKYQGVPQLDFVGNYQDSAFNTTLSNYLGEWDKPTLYANLTDYGNLVLLSDGEADPLVVKEALIAGLGVVISECASANLDTTLPFITVIPDEKRDDLNYVCKAIHTNRTVSLENRASIREYALSKFSWEGIVSRYLDTIPEYTSLIT
jgi:glycosyltransferase involved in cell wall biosynthesis